MAHKFHRDDATFALIAETDIASTVWSTYAPTVLSTLGSFTSTPATGRWQAIGKTTFLSIVVSIIDSGTGSTSITVSLPAVSAASRQELVGKEVAVHGRMLIGDVQTSSSVMSITDFNNSFPVSTGAVLTITGIYEQA